MAQIRRVDFETSGGEKGKCLHPCKSENEGISNSCVVLRHRLASSFSLAEKSIATQKRADDHDEHNQADILTSGLNLAPAFPVLTSGCGSL
jgi:hypothetical protein